MSLGIASQGSVPQAIVIVGAGPGGLGPLFAAANVGRLNALLEGGVTILERSQRLGGGALGQYSIRSDSSAEAFLDIVVRTEEPRLQALRNHPIAQELATYGTGSAPLTLAAKFLELASQTLCRIVAESPRGRVLLGVEVTGVTQVSAAEWRTRFVHAASGVEHEVASHSVVLATGANQPQRRLWSEPVAGHPLLPRFAGKVLQSGDIFAHDGEDRVIDLLHGKPDPKIVIVGGSTSAGAIAVCLLQRMPRLNMGAGSITILHRKPLRIFYNNATEALADGYTEFTNDDICHITGRVFRLSGFRLDSRELIMSARGIGGRAPEPRVRLQHLGEESFAEAQAAMAEADLVIAALGYRPRAGRVMNSDGSEIELHQPGGDRWAIVDQRCRVLRSDGTPLEGLFALGLAVGPGASHELGGEANFRGQVNSLWLWQHTLGLRVADAATERYRLAVNGQLQPVTVPSTMGKQVVPMRFPVIRPVPPRLSRHALELSEIENSGVYSNYGPVNTRLESDLRSLLFGEGHCLTVCNATNGLMMAIREVIGEPRPGEVRYALMPSFTFAATAHAALWCGLKPLLCDIDPHTWLPSHSEEQKLLEMYGDRIAVVVPYATFGNCLDLDHYRDLARRYNVPVVVDAAASLGSLDEQGEQFGRGFEWPVVFSMHATKPFSVGEGGLIYSADADRIARMRTMGSFGFGEPRTSTMIGLNSKMPEVTALTALLELRRFPEVARHREEIADAYRTSLAPAFIRQRQQGQRQSRAFESVLLPESLRHQRPQVQERLKTYGIGSGSYFSPHLAEQSYLRQNSEAGELAVTDDIAGRILSLPILDGMGVADAAEVSASLLAVTESLEAEQPKKVKRSSAAADVIMRTSSALLSL